MFLHPPGGSIGVQAVEYELVPGEAAMQVFLIGHNETGVRLHGVLGWDVREKF